MKFFKNLFTKNQYGNALQFEDNECTHCHDVPHKLKKCHDCEKRNICRDCFYHKNHNLCKGCDDKYNQWINKVEDAGVKAEKEQKYNTKYDFDHDSFL